MMKSHSKCKKFLKLTILIVRVVVSKSVVCHFIVDSMPTFYKIESIELNLTDPRQYLCFSKGVISIAEKPNSVDST